METETPNIDAHLADKSLLQYAFKSNTVRAVAVAIALAAVAAPGSTVWPDEIELPELVNEDKNIIGLCFKNLAKWKMIERLEGAGQHRRSRVKSSKGRTVFQYRVINVGLLKTFLKRNGVTAPNKQLDLAI